MTDEKVSRLRAVAHPVRLRILSLLTGADMSAAEVARELDLTHANASYHLRVLAEAGELEVAGEERIRGGVAKRYRHPWDRVEQPAAAGGDDARLAVLALTSELTRRFDARRPGTPTFLTDAEVWVEPAVWERATALLREAATLLHENARPPRTEGALHVNGTIAAFQMHDPHHDPHHDTGRDTGRATGHATEQPS